ncbi:MAG TPA: glycosyltransferase, partial [Thermoanaerobaculia bacterium]|nr:glycosyltransferase [Thermoanaerobaculia bacterium]
LPANGVMQISDCPDVGRIYEVGTEIDSYRTVDDLIDRIRYYLVRPEERMAVARAGYRRTMAEYRIRDVLRRAGGLIERGMRAAAT